MENRSSLIKYLFLVFIMMFVVLLPPSAAQAEDVLPPTDDVDMQHIDVDNDDDSVIDKEVNDLDMNDD